MIKFTRTTGYTAEGNPIKVTETVGVGTTLYTKSNTERVMSDVWEWITSAYYWDIDSHSMKSIWLGETTECVIDGHFDAIKNDFFAAAFKRYLAYHTRKAEEIANTPDKGRTVKVVRGKTSKGVVGKVVVAIERPYSMGWKTSLEMKLGIALDDEMTTYTAKNGKQYPTHKNIVWVWARNCDVVNPEIDTDYVKTLAMRDAEREVFEVKSCIAKSHHKPVALAA